MQLNSMQELDKSIKLPFKYDIVFKTNLTLRIYFVLMPRVLILNDLSRNISSLR